MDLFIVKRFEGDHEITQEEEKSKLDQLLQKIEKNKRRQRKKKELNESRIVKTSESEQKIESNTEIVPVPPNNLNEFIDKSNQLPTVDNNIETNFIKGNKRKRGKNVLPEIIEGFTILGGDSDFKKKKVKRVLPNWLAEPTIISTNLKELNMKVSSMKQLDSDLRKKLKANGVDYFFPVQAEVIPWLLKANNHSSVLFPRDICVSAPTGSGKTLAFALPIIQSLKQHLVKKIRALVLLPTQDLAVQVFRTFKTYCENTSVDVCILTGKQMFKVEQTMMVSKNEAFGYLSKTDIVVCTAGRLVDHLKHTEGFDLRDLEFLIIDEADRVLDCVQHDWLYHLENHLKSEDPESINMKVVNLFHLRKKRPPQKLLFSATLSEDPEKLQKLSLFQPKLFTSVIDKEDMENDNYDEKESINSHSFIGKYTTPKELSEKYITCPLDIKPLVLYKYIKMHNLTKTLIFTNSIIDAHRLCILLRGLFGSKLTIEEMSSHLEMKNRRELTTKFLRNNIDLLICTDTLARGIDLPEVQCVISYSAPKHLKTYIHRAGRTARAGALGTAVTLLQPSQVSQFKSLLKHAGKNNVSEVEVQTNDLEPLAKKYEKALNELKQTVHREEVDDLNKIKRTKQFKIGKFKRKTTNTT